MRRRFGAPGLLGLPKVGSLRQYRPAGSTLRFHINPEQVLTSPRIGTWAEESHPRQDSSTVYVGRPLREVALPLTLMARTSRGQVDPQGSVEGDMALLEVWGQPTNTDEPPVLELDYGPDCSGLYVMQGATPTYERRRASDLARFVVELDVRLLEWREARVLLTPVAKAVAKLPAATLAPTGRTYTVVSGDNLQKIAARLLGKASRWTQIRDLNQLRDPNRIRPGQILKIPNG